VEKSNVVFHFSAFDYRDFPSTWPNDDVRAERLGEVEKYGGRYFAFLLAFKPLVANGFYINRLKNSRLIP
jgi:hypothetical protein